MASESIKVNVSVKAIVLTLSGILNHYQLIDAKDGAIEKNQIKALFNPMPGKYPTYKFHTEQDLSSYLDKQQGIKLSIGRFKLPRIRWLSIYWPPSKKAMLALARIYKEKTEQGQPLTCQRFLDEMKGHLNVLWEPTESPVLNGRDHNNMDSVHQGYATTADKITC
jgi:hypothetical protein